MNEETQQIQDVISNSQHEDLLHLMINAALLAASIYIGAFIAAKGWQAAGGEL